MSKLQGLRALQSHFEFNGHNMAHTLLYQNLPADKLLAYQPGLGRMTLVAKECSDIAWALGLLRQDCAHGLAGTEPDEYDPFFDGDGNPPLAEPRPYDAYREMAYYLHPDETPHGLGLDLSPDLLAAVDSLIASKDGLNRYATQEGLHLMTRDSDEEALRPMTEQEVICYARREESRVLEDCVFTVGFNQDLARLRQLVAGRGSFQEILDLIGPAPIADDAPF